MNWSKETEDFSERYKEENGEYPSDEACELLEAISESEESQK